MERSSFRGTFWHLGRDGVEGDQGRTNDDGLDREKAKKTPLPIRTRVTASAVPRGLILTFFSAPMSLVKRFVPIATESGTIERVFLTWVTGCPICSWAVDGEERETTALSFSKKPLSLFSFSLPRKQNSASRVKATYGPLDYAASVLPCVRWLSTYPVKSSLLFDVLAGASVAALVVPQGMSYARLAGLPQEYGLYGAFVPVMVYAALGSSKHLVSY